MLAVLERSRQRWMEYLHKLWPYRIGNSRNEKTGRRHRKLAGFGCASVFTKRKGIGEIIERTTVMVMVTWMVWVGERESGGEQLTDVCGLVSCLPGQDPGQARTATSGRGCARSQDQHQDGSKERLTGDGLVCHSQATAGFRHCRHYTIRSLAPTSVYLSK